MTQTKKPCFSQFYNEPIDAPVLREYLCKWKLENFSLMQNNDVVISPPFCLKPVGEWQLELKRRHSDYFNFYFIRHSDKQDIKVDFTISALSLRGIIAEKKTGQINPPPKCPYFLHDNLRTAAIINDTIIFMAEFKIAFPTYIIRSALSEFWKEDSKQQSLITLQNDYKNHLAKGKHSDITLRVGKKENFSVHKFILAARSPVFERMFEQKDTVEQKNRTVDIEDMDMRTLRELVTFLYCGELVDYDFEVAMKVYYAADKYEVLDLRRHCCDRIMHGLNKNNRFQALVLAEKHDDQYLKDKIFEFMGHQWEEKKKQSKGETNELKN